MKWRRHWTTSFLLAYLVLVAFVVWFRSLNSSSLVLVCLSLWRASVSNLLLLCFYILFNELICCSLDLSKSLFIFNWLLLLLLLKKTHLLLQTLRYHHIRFYLILTLFLWVLRSFLFLTPWRFIPLRFTFILWLARVTFLFFHFINDSRRPSFSSDFLTYNFVWSHSRWRLLVGNWLTVLIHISFLILWEVIMIIHLFIFTVILSPLASSLIISLTFFAIWCSLKLMTASRYLQLCCHCLRLESHLSSPLWYILSTALSLWSYL